MLLSPAIYLPICLCCRYFEAKLLVFSSRCVGVGKTFESPGV